MSLTEQIRTDYRRDRAAEPYRSAKDVLSAIKHYAQTTPIPSWIPSYPQERGRVVDGLEYRFTYEQDEWMSLEDIGAGEMASHPTGGAGDCQGGWVSHAKRRGRGERDQYEWWKTHGCTAEETAKWHHERGMAKGPAHNLGVSVLLQDYQHSMGIEQVYTLIVKVHDPKTGQELGSASVGGNVTEEKGWVRETYRDLAEEAESEAREALAEEEADERREGRRSLAWKLVEQAAEGDDIKVKATLLLAAELTDTVREGVTG